LLNQEAHGYAKFVIDELTLNEFAKPGQLSKIKSSLERRQIYNMMFDMIKSGKIAGSRLLHIVLQNVETETAEDVMGDILRFVIPQVIKKYLPEESY